MKQSKDLVAAGCNACIRLVCSAAHGAGFKPVKAVTACKGMLCIFFCQSTARLRQLASLVLDASTLDVQGWVGGRKKGIDPQGMTLKNLEAEKRQRVRRFNQD